MRDVGEEERNWIIGNRNEPGWRCQRGARIFVFRVPRISRRRLSRACSRRSHHEACRFGEGPGRSAVRSSTRKNGRLGLSANLPSRRPAFNSPCRRSQHCVVSCTLSVIKRTGNPTREFLLWVKATLTPLRRTPRPPEADSRRTSRHAFRADIVAKVFGVADLNFRAADAFYAWRREGPYRFIQNRSGDSRSGVESSTQQPRSPKINFREIFGGRSIRLLHISANKRTHAPQQL